MKCALFIRTDGGRYCVLLILRACTFLLFIQTNRCGCGASGLSSIHELGIYLCGTLRLWDLQHLIVGPKCNTSVEWEIQKYSRARGVRADVRCGVIAMIPRIYETWLGTSIPFQSVDQQSLFLDVHIVICDTLNARTVLVAVAFHI